MIEKTGFNINKILGSGTLILPISMSRIAGGQSPEECYEMVEYFTNKIESFNNDVVLLYTNGLYFNTEDVAFEKRVKMNNQVINHSASLRKIIDKDRKYVLKAFHFTPIDYIILNSVKFQEMFNLLKQKEREDSNFQNFIKEDTIGREYTEANINFILEEIVVAHIIREQFVDLPMTLAKLDEWRIFCYPGTSLKSDIYVYQQGYLEKNKSCSNDYRGSMYNFKDKVLEVFSDIKL